MSVAVGAAISDERDSLAAAAAAGRSVADTLDGATPDLVLVFASGEHLANPQRVLVPLHAALAPRVLVGCAAGGVLGASTITAITLLAVPQTRYKIFPNARKREYLREKRSDAKVRSEGKNPSRWLRASTPTAPP